MKNNNSEDSEIQPENPLFRKEVLQKQKLSYLGKVLVVTPISFLLWSLGIFLFATALILFLCFGKYTKRQEVHGMLVPDKGLVNVYAKTSGVVVNRFVQQGDEVKEGQLLYLVSTEQHTLTDQSISKQQTALLEKQIEMQSSRVAILEEDISRYKKLFDSHFISKLDYQKHYSDYLTAKSDLHGLEYRLNEIKSSGDYTIRAPGDGAIAVLTTMVGSRVTDNSLLVSIIPKDAVLEGVLYVPSSAVGFITQGQKVLLKYQAYPYQQFGLYEANVSYIDRSILSPGDIKTSINLNAPFYRVVVTLKSNAVTVYGKSVPLVAGMLLEATILSEERNIWKWIMNPIYSLKGAVIS